MLYRVQIRMLAKLNQYSNCNRTVTSTDQFVQFLQISKCFLIYGLFDVLVWSKICLGFSILAQKQKHLVSQLNRHGEKKVILNTRPRPWRRQWLPTPVLLPGKSHGRRSLVGCSPQGRKELDTTKQLHFHFSLSCTGEGNGNPLQCSCLENPRDGGGACWPAVYGVAESRTQLK